MISLINARNDFELNGALSADCELNYYLSNKNVEKKYFLFNYYDEGNENIEMCRL